MAPKSYTYNYSVTDKYATSATIAYLFASSRGNKFRVIANYIVIAALIWCVFVSTVVLFMDSAVFINLALNIFLPIFGITVIFSGLMTLYFRKTIITASGGIGASVEIKVNDKGIKAKTTGIEQALEYSVLNGYYERGDMIALYYGANRRAIIVMQVDAKARKIIESNLDRI